MLPEPLPEQFIEELQELLSRYGFKRSAVNPDQSADDTTSTAKEEGLSANTTEIPAHTGNPVTNARAEKAARLLKLMKKPR